MMCFPLVLEVELLPFSLEGGDKLCSFFLRHQHLLFVSFVLLLNLHFLDQVVLVGDLILDFGQIAGCLAVSLLLQKVLVLRGRQFGG